VEQITFKLLSFLMFVQLLNSLILNIIKTKKETQNSNFDENLKLAGLTGLHKTHKVLIDFSDLIVHLV
jgi:hypothetical protein